jgi:hypothetical protein
MPMKHSKAKGLGDRFYSAFDRLRAERLFSDKLSLGILAGSLVLVAATQIVLLTRVHPIDYPIPVQYSNLSDPVLGSWYDLYKLGFFSAAVFFINTYLALRAFSKSRITSFFLLGSTFVVCTLCLVVTIAFIRFL